MLRRWFQLVFLYCNIHFDIFEKLLSHVCGLFLSISQYMHDVFIIKYSSNHKIRKYCYSFQSEVVCSFRLPMTIT